MGERVFRKVARIPARVASTKVAWASRMPPKYGDLSGERKGPLRSFT